MAAQHELGMNFKMAKLSLEPPAALEFIGPEDRVISLTALIKPGTMAKCRMSDAKDPMEFYVVPWDYEKPHLGEMKKFRQYYADMDQGQIEASQPGGGILYDDYHVAVFHKSRWHRGSILEEFQKEAASGFQTWYNVFFLDTGEREEVNSSNVRRLLRRFVLSWPALAVRCTFALNSNIWFFGNEISTEYFHHFASANPECDVVFTKLTNVNELHTWDVEVIIKIKPDVRGHIRPGGPRTTEERIDLKRRMGGIVRQGLTHRSQLWDFY